MEPTLRQVLEFRDDAHYIPREGHPGFGALAEPSEKGQSSNWLYEGCDPTTGEKTPREFVLPPFIAANLAIEFLGSEGRLSAISWFEL